MNWQDHTKSTEETLRDALMEKEGQIDILKRNVNELQTHLQQSYKKIDRKNSEIEKLQRMLVEAVVEKS
jgi:peptidoglycan hydrolase CwlO-like protein